MILPAEWCATYAHKWAKDKESRSTRLGCRCKACSGLWTCCISTKKHEGASFSFASAPLGRCQACICCVHCCPKSSRRHHITNGSRPGSMLIVANQSCVLVEFLCYCFLCFSKLQFFPILAQNLLWEPTQKFACQGDPLAKKTIFHFFDKLNNNTTLFSSNQDGLRA